MAGPVTLQDLYNVCRMCLSKGANQKFTALTTEPARGAFIQSTQIYVHDQDGLPQRICKTCLERCNAWMKFRNKAEENQKYLQALLDESQWTPEETTPLAKGKVKSRKNQVIELVVPEDQIDHEEEFEDIAGELVETNIVVREDTDDDGDKDDPNPEADTDAVEMATDWESVLHDATVYPIEPTPTVNRQGNDPVITCPVADCAQGFVGFKSYETHCMTHVDKKNIICPICELLYERAENYKNHMYIHANQKFGCPECDKLFTRPKTLSDHMRDAHCKFMRKEKEDPLPGFCSAPVARKRKSTGAVEVGGAKPPTTPTEDFGDGSEIVILCPVCLLSCSSYKSFEDHTATHVTRSSRNCPLCKQKFVRMENLKYHMYVHTDNKFDCAHCSRTFVNPKTLSSHVRVDHATVDEPRREADGTNRGGTCSYCSKSFENNRQLREHLKLHTADTRYPCSECPVRFRLKRSLKAHMVSVHKGTRLLACSICGLSFESKELGKHMLGEHPNVANLCKECGSVHRSSQALRMHRLAVHSTPNPSVCPICGKSFKKKRRMKEHLETHVKEEELCCVLCGAQFPRIQSLRTHVKNVHNVEAESVKS